MRTEWIVVAIAAAIGLYAIVVFNRLIRGRNLVRRLQKEPGPRRARAAEGGNSIPAAENNSIEYHYRRRSIRSRRAFSHGTGKPYFSATL